MTAQHMRLLSQLLQGQQDLTSTAIQGTQTEQTASIQHFLIACVQTAGVQCDCSCGKVQQCVGLELEHCDDSFSQ